jgi:hypothetical protein
MMVSIGDLQFSMGSKCYCSSHYQNIDYNKGEDINVKADESAHRFDWGLYLKPFE